MGKKLLIINPGSTSTKIAVFDDETPVFEETLRHSTEEIQIYPTIYDQKDFRLKVIKDVLAEKNFDVKDLDAVVGRGGLVKPVPSGTYEVSDVLLEDLKKGVQGQHASNLGGVLARQIADPLGIPSYIVDPTVVDEMAEISKFTGNPDFQKRSIFHALNQKAVARRYAKENGKKYEDINLIVVHMGGGVSIGAHRKGLVIDVNNALDGNGPFTPERAGTIPAGQLIQMCFSGEYNRKQVLEKVLGKGGFNAYMGTNDARIVEQKVEDGDEYATKVFRAFLYQVSQYIGAMSTALCGEVDQIILTGGIAYSPMVAEEIKRRTGWIAGITVYPGEDEMLSLAQGGLRVLNGEEPAKVY